jgi:hypothetical protein
LSLFRQESCREVLRLVQEDLRADLALAVRETVPVKSAITQARDRLGVTPLQTLYEQLVTPQATPQTRGAWYKRWRLVALDGTLLATPDSASNTATFGYSNSKHGPSAFPLARLVTLVEVGTHTLFAASLGAYRDAETTLAFPLIERAVTAEMLLLADRNFYSHARWQQAAATGAALLWRVKSTLTLPVEALLPDGSYLTTVGRTSAQHPGIRVRVICYRLAGSAEVYRLLTNLLDPQEAPADDLARLYHERWDHEGTLDELKAHLCGTRRLRSETPDLVKQEIYGLLLAHYAVRAVMHTAALEADEDPDRLSFTHTLCVLRRKLPQLAALPPSAVVPLVGKGPRRSATGTGLVEPGARCAPRRATTH